MSDDDIPDYAGLQAIIQELIAERDALLEMVRTLAGTEWTEHEPGSRLDLPDEWEPYVDELEAFANHWVKTARAALAEKEHK